MGLYGYVPLIASMRSIVLLFSEMRLIRYLSLFHLPRGAKEEREKVYRTFFGGGRGEA